MAFNSNSGISAIGVISEPKGFSLAWFGQTQSSSSMGGS